MRHCSRCGGMFDGGTLLCYSCQKTVLREIRRQAAEREDMLREEDPDD